MRHPHLRELGIAFGTEASKPCPRAMRREVLAFSIEPTSCCSYRRPAFRNQLFYNCWAYGLTVIVARSRSCEPGQIFDRFEITYHSEDRG